MKMSASRSSWMSMVKRSVLCRWSVFIDGCWHPNESRSLAVLENAIRRTSDEAYFVNGSVSLRQLAKHLGIAVPDESVATVAGFIQRNNQRLPRVGDHAELDRFTLTVVEELLGRPRDFGDVARAQRRTWRRLRRSWMTLLAAGLFVLGLVLSAFFSGSETGLYRVSRTRLVLDRLARLVRCQGVDLVVEPPDDLCGNVSRWQQPRKLPDQLRDGAGDRDAVCGL